MFVQSRGLCKQGLYYSLFPIQLAGLSLPSPASPIQSAEFSQWLPRPRLSSQRSPCPFGRLSQVLAPEEGKGAAVRPTGAPGGSGLVSAAGGRAPQAVPEPCGSGWPSVGPRREAGGGRARSHVGRRSQPVRASGPRQACSVAPGLLDGSVRSERPATRRLVTAPPDGL